MDPELVMLTKQSYNDKIDMQYVHLVILIVLLIIILYYMTNGFGLLAGRRVAQVDSIVSTYVPTKNAAAPAAPEISNLGMTPAQAMAAAGESEPGQSASSVDNFSVAYEQFSDPLPKLFGRENFAPYASILTPDIGRSDAQFDRSLRTTAPTIYDQRSSENMLFNQLNALSIMTPL
jgi:hypothetical protein